MHFLYNGQYLSSSSTSAKGAEISPSGNIELLENEGDFEITEADAAEYQNKAVDFPVKHEHSWNTFYTVDQAATCSSSGSKSIHCSICDMIKDGSSVQTAKTAHTYGAWKTVKAATEITTGQKSRTCKLCGSTQKSVIAMLKPSLSPVRILKPAAGKKSAKIKWKKLSAKKLKKIKKIEIQYSTDKSFKSGVRTAYCAAKKTSKTVKSLKKGKKYFVRIRSYTKKGSAVHISKWSAVKSVKAK